MVALPRADSRNRVLGRHSRLGSASGLDAFGLSNYPDGSIGLAGLDGAPCVVSGASAPKKTFVTTRAAVVKLRLPTGVQMLALRSRHKATKKPR